MHIYNQFTAIYEKIRTVILTLILPASLRHSFNVVLLFLFSFMYLFMYFLLHPSQISLLTNREELAVMSCPFSGSWGVLNWGTLGCCSGLGRRGFRLSHQIPKTTIPLNCWMGSACELLSLGLSNIYWDLSLGFGWPTQRQSDLSWIHSRIVLAVFFG